MFHFKGVLKKNSSKRGDRSGIKGEGYPSPKFLVFFGLMSLVQLVWSRSPGSTHIFAFGFWVLSPALIADSPAASAGRGCVQGNGRVSRAVGAVPCIAFYSVSLLGSRTNFRRGPSQEAVDWANLWPGMNIMIKILACRLISEAFSQVREINSR